MSLTIDAKGLSCPQPVIMALKALSDGAESFVVEVDHETAAENVERACREKGKATSISKNTDGYSVTVSSR